jgi:hypothetical protein
VEIDRESRTSEDTNSITILETLLRYGLVSGIDLGYVGGSVLPAEALTRVSRFSVRNSWVGTIHGPIAPQDVVEIGAIDSVLADLPEIGFLLGPAGASFFDPQWRVVVEDYVLSRSLGKVLTSHLFTVSYTSDGVIVEFRADIADVPLRFRSPPPDLAPIAGGYVVGESTSLAALKWAPFLYQALDENAAAISHELHGLVRERTDAHELALGLRERYEIAVTARGRERRYLELATDALTTQQRLPGYLAFPVLLPESVLTPPELEYREITTLLASIQDSIGRADDNPDLTKWLDGCRHNLSERQEGLVPDVRISRQDSDHLLVDDIGGRRIYYLFQASLSTFSPESDQIKRSLNRQATLLQVLNSLAPLEIQLAYRLFTVAVPSGELVARFEVEATVSGCDAAEAAALRDSVGELVHAAFIGAYGLSFTFSPLRGGARDEARMRHPQFEREIIRAYRSPGAFETFAGEPDWGYILDYLLTLQYPVAITLRASAAGYAADNRSPTEHVRSLIDRHDDSSASFLRDALRRAAQTTDEISLRVTVGSNHGVSVPLLNLVGTEIAGPSGFEVVEYAAASDDSGRRRMALVDAFSVFHAPYGDFFATKIGHRVTRIPSAVDAFPVAGIELGTAYRAHAKAERPIKVRIAETDALRHLYVVGRTGSGKTNFLRGLAAQHLLSPGTGLAVIDPHGDLASHVLNSVPGARVDEVVTVDLTDPELLPVLNPLAFDGADAVSRSRLVQDVLELIKQRLYHEWSGPRFDEIVRLVLDTMLDGGYPVAASLIDVPRILTDSRLQRDLIKGLRDPELVARWHFHQRLASTREYPDLMDWVVSKFDDISRDESLRMILGGEHNTVDIDQVVRDNGVLIVRLPEADVGRQAAEFIGSLVLQQLRSALLRRHASGPRAGKFFVYVDEFQKFATTAFAELVAEARKYGVGTVLAHQNLEQLKVFSPKSGQQDQSILSAILGNAGSMVCFGVGAPDTDTLATQLGVSRKEVSEIGRYEALARLSLDGAWIPTMTLRTQLHQPELDPRRQDEIREFQADSGRLVRRAEIRRQIETRRNSLTAIVSNDSGPVKLGSNVGTFIEEWRAKRESAKPPRLERSNAVNGDASGAPPESARPCNVRTAGEPAGGGVSDAPREGSSWSALIGPVVRLDRVADRLGDSVEVIRGRMEMERLLVLTTQRGTEVVPASHLTEHGVLPGLEGVLAGLARTDWSAWSKAGWLAQPLAGLGGRSTLDWLRDGLEPSLPATIAAGLSE